MIDIKKIKELKNCNFDELNSDMLEFFKKNKNELGRFENNIFNLIWIVFTTYLQKDQDKAIEFKKNKELVDLDLKINEMPNILNDLILKIRDKYSIDTLLAYLLFVDDQSLAKSNPYVKTPDSLIELAKEILNIQSQDEVLDLCSGMGFSILNAYLDEPNANYTGIEISREINLLARMKKFVLSTNWDLYSENVFEFPMNRKFDKIFSNYPFILRYSLSNELMAELQKLTGLEEKSISRLSSDWIFNLIMISRLKDNGKALAIMSNGPLTKLPDGAIRQWLIENGYIEAIIALPEKMFYNTSISTAMIVFSKGNKKIKMVDATVYGKEEKRLKIFLPSDIHAIVANLNQMNQKSSLIDSKLASQFAYSLSPLKYIYSLMDSENSQKLDDLAVVVKRGLQIKANSFNKLKSSNKTKYRYITISDIDDGFIKDNENYLKNISKDMEKYIIKNDCLVITKTANPFFKSAVVKLQEDELVIATGNIYIVEFDQSKVRPQYVQAFFMSENGRRSIKSISVGGALPIISIKDLKELFIPVLNFEKQDKIALEYISSINEMQRLKKQYLKTKESLTYIYDKAKK